MSVVWHLFLHQIPGLLVGAAIGLAVGVLVIAPALEKGRPRMRTTESKSAVRLAYEKWAPALVGVALLTGIFGSALSTLNQHTTNVETSRRISQSNALLECFDRFASNLAGGLPPVRVASAQRDDALSLALTAFGRVLVESADGAVPSAELARASTAFAAYHRAARHLERVRAANPYPAPPSQFCDVQITD